MANSVKERCTQKVIATCTGEEVRHQEGEPFYYPVYEFDYRGQHFRVSPNHNSYLPAVGTKHEIFINPENPEEYYHPIEEKHKNRWLMFFVIPFVLAFIFFGVVFALTL